MNPIASMTKQQVTPGVRRHVRRALEYEEAVTLLAASRCGPDHYGMTGEERYWLYRLALETALRAAELRALTRENFDLESDEPLVWLSGDATKNRQMAELPLRQSTAGELRRFLETLTSNERVFQMPRDDLVVRMLRRDLKAASISYETGAGVVDFHAMRTTCLSWLANEGVPLKTLQVFARHSTPVLTMNCYARTLQGTLAAAALKLPDLHSRTPATLRATGTNNARSQASVTGGHTGGNAAHKRSPACTSMRDTQNRATRQPARKTSLFRDNLTENPDDRGTGADGNRPHQRLQNSPSTALKAAESEPQLPTEQALIRSTDPDWRTYWRETLQQA